MRGDLKKLTTLNNIRYQNNQVKKKNLTPTHPILYTVKSKVIYFKTQASNYPRQTITPGLKNPRTKKAFFFTLKTFSSSLLLALSKL